MAQHESDSLGVRFVYWEDTGMWVGYLEEFLDYWTQRTSLEDLQEHLLDILRTLVQR